jgi:hypothetical protein
VNRNGDIFWSVDPDDKAVFDAWCQRHGTTRNFAGGNLLRWFNDQDDVLKEHIAKLITDRADVRELLIKALKARPRRRPKP